MIARAKVLMVGAAMAGGLVVVSTIGSTALATVDLGGATKVLTDGSAIAINMVTLLVSFQLLVNTHIGWRTLLPGAAAGGFGLFVLQILGTWYMTKTIERATNLYGTFAVAFGLLVWIALLARVVLLAAEVNVVWSKHLWPRSLTGRHLGEPDHLALADAVARESLSDDLVVSTTVPPAGDERPLPG